MTKHQLASLNFGLTSNDITLRTPTSVSTPTTTTTTTITSKPTTTTKSSNGKGIGFKPGARGVGASLSDCFNGTQFAGKGCGCGGG